MNKQTFATKRAYKEVRDRLLDAQDFRAALVLKHADGKRTLYYNLQATDRDIVLSDLTKTDATAVTVYSSGVDEHHDIDAWREVNWGSADIIEKFTIDPDVARGFAHDLSKHRDIIPLAKWSTESAEGLAILVALFQLAPTFLVTNRNPDTPSKTICVGKAAVEHHIHDTLGELSQFLGKFDVLSFKSDIHLNVHFTSCTVRARTAYDVTVDGED